MPNYHLYFMSKGAPVGSQAIVASDVAEATRIAQATKEGDAVELWNEHRRLTVLGPGRRPHSPTESADAGIRRHGT